MGKIGLIVGREYLTRVRKKSFIVMTILGPLLMAGSMLLLIWLAVSQDTAHNVLVVDDIGLTTNLLKDKEKIKFHYTDKTISKEDFLKEESYDLLLYVTHSNNASTNTSILNGGKAQMLYKKLPSLEVQSYITSQLNNVLEQYRLEKAETQSPEIKKFIREEYPKFKKLTEIEVKDAETSEDGKQQNMYAAVGFTFAFLIYFFIFLYGVQVMRGVIEEKTSRIVEVIISSVKPFELMMGKIIGIALVGLTQFALWVILTGSILLISKSTFLPGNYDAAAQAQVEQTAVNVSAEQPAELLTDAQNENFDLIFNRINWGGILGLFLFYFMGGYLLYGSLYAAIGSAVDNEADTQQFMLPITIPLVFGFVIAQMAITNPESPVVFWGSMIPFTSPIVMMVRVPAGIPYWELGLSMFLLVATFIFTTWIAGKIYRTGILMYGKKVSYKELWKWLFYKG